MLKRVFDLTMVVLKYFESVCIPLNLGVDFFSWYEFVLKILLVFKETNILSGIVTKLINALG